LGWPQPGYLNCAAKKVGTQKGTHMSESLYLRRCGDTANIDQIVRKLRQLPGNVLRVGRNRRWHFSGGTEHDQQLHEGSADHVPTSLAPPCTATLRQMTLDEPLCEPFVDVGNLDTMFSHPMREMRNAPNILAN